MKVIKGAGRDRRGNGAGNLRRHVHGTAVRCSQQGGNAFHEATTVVCAA